MAELSPAVERAKDAAAGLAERGGFGPDVRVGHWLLALLEDDEGRPAALLARLGTGLSEFRERLGESVADSLTAPDATHLFAAARAQSLRLRADPDFTSDVVLLALLLHDAEYAGRMGLDVQQVADALRTVEIASAETDTTGGFAFDLGEPAETVAAARAVDANLNRAREALRVLDDYARFTRNDGGLARQFKEMRHRLAAASERLPVAALLAARDTPGDVGTAISTASEFVRHSPDSVAVANVKRLQEALRSLEEFGKVLSAEFAAAVETIRYESYTVEVAMRREGGTAKLASAKLYLLLTGSKCAGTLDWTIAEAAGGGVDVVQLREKELPDRELLARAVKVRKWTRAAGVLFIVNDRPDIARLAEADGVHLGQDDLSVQAARRIVGPDALVGVSTHDVSQVRKAVRDGADYLGVGPVFPSETKHFDHFPGLDFVREAVAETSLPAFALGGISLANIAAVRAVGATRVAVSSAIATADSPRGAAAALRQRLG